MKVQLYIEAGEVDGKTVYDILDMFDDEKINMNLKNTDSKEFGKAYSDFSQSFTIPASDKNNKLVRYIYDAFVNSNKKSKLKGKIYINHSIFREGYFVLENTKMKNLVPSSHSISFKTSIFNLKDTIGNETLFDVYRSIELGDWDYSTLLNGLESDTNEDIFVPLVSTSRVFNISRGTNNDISTTDGKLNLSSVKPAISFRHLFNAVVDKYELDIEFPFKDEIEFKRAHLWMNYEGTLDNLEVDFINQIYLDGTHSGFTVKATPLIDLTTNVVTLEKTDNTNLRLRIGGKAVINKVYGSGNMDVIYRVVDVRNIDPLKHTVIAEQTLNGNSGDEFEFFTDINSDSIPNFSATNPLKYKIFIYAAVDINIPNMSHIVAITNINSGQPPYFFISFNHKVRTRVYSLSNLIPQMKVIDFLTGIIKMFNIEIITDALIPNKMTWKLKSDTVRGYVDYTELLDIENITIEKVKKFKTYNFQHKENDLYSSKAFRDALTNSPNQKEYGQLMYTEDGIDSGEGTYDIKTEFSITPPRILEGSQLNFFYGFDYGTERPFKGNNKDFLIFYKTNRRSITNSNGISGLNWIRVSTGVGTHTDIYYVNGVNIGTSDIENGGSLNPFKNSLGYKDEVNLMPIQFPMKKNLFSNYYAYDVERINNNNTKLYKFDIFMSAIDIMRLDMSNIVIIRNQKFSIESINLELTSGKASLTLMNYAPAPVGIVIIAEPPTPPTTQIIVIE